MGVPNNAGVRTAQFYEEFVSLQLYITGANERFRRRSPSWLYDYAYVLLIFASHSSVLVNVATMYLIASVITMTLPITL